jgi:hypothetical protein
MEAMNSELEIKKAASHRLRVLEYIAQLTDEEIETQLLHCHVGPLDPKKERQQLTRDYLNGIRPLPPIVEPKNYDGTKCPMCESTNIEPERALVRLEGPHGNRNAKCKDCEAEWREVIDVSGYCDLIR